MSEAPHYVSPINGHFHYSESARRVCAVCSLEDDRDRGDAELGHQLEHVDRLTAERDRLRDAVAAYQRTYHALDGAFDDDNIDSVGPQYCDWKAAQNALLELPTADAGEGT